MKTLIILSGVSGVGKTRHRENHPDFKDLPCVDMADIYRDIPNIPRGISGTMALWTRVAGKFKEHGVDTVVAEGYFLKGTESRGCLVTMAKNAGVKVRIINFWAPLDECEKRLRLQQMKGKASAAEVELRIEMLKRCWREKGK